MDFIKKPNQVTVLLTCYNEKAYIGAALDSVLCQENFDIISEIVIVDDGSTDGSLEILDSYKSKHKKIRVIKQQNGGLANARNAGLRTITEGYIAILDGDDIWEPSKIKKQISFMKLEKCDFSYTAFVEFQEGGVLSNKIIPNKIEGHGKKAIEQLYLFGGPILPSSVIFKSSSAKRIGYFDEAFRQAEDTDFWLRILEKDNCKLLDEALVKRRLHNASLSANLTNKYHYQLQLIEKMNSYHPFLKKYGWLRRIKLKLKIFKRVFIEKNIYHAIKELLKLR